MKNKILIGLILAIMLISTIVTAVLVIDPDREGYNMVDWGSNNSHYNTWFGQRFNTSTNGKLVSMDFLLNCFNSNNANFTMYLYDNKIESGGNRIDNMTKNILCTTKDMLDWNTFNFSRIDITSGTNYFLYIQSPYNKTYQNWTHIDWINYNKSLVDYQLAVQFPLSNQTYAGEFTYKFVGNQTLITYDFDNGPAGLIMKVAIDVPCHANITYTPWSKWFNSSCSGDQMEQMHYRIQYDAANCGNFTNTTEYDYQLVGPLWKNNTPTGWVNLTCLSGDTMNQSNTTIQSDEYGCADDINHIAFKNELYCDYCTPVWVNDTSADWIDDSCQINDTMMQHKTVTQSDTLCGEDNIIHIVYQSNEYCDYCSSSVVYSAWTDWYDVSGCYVNDSKEQERNMTQYDENNATCYTVTGLISDMWNNGESITYYEYQSIGCDNCTPNMVEEEWGNWDDYTCNLNNTMKQVRNTTRYDSEYCGEEDNTTLFEFQDTGLFCNTTVIDNSSETNPEVPYTGILEVQFKKGNDVVVEFKFNFDNASLDLNNMRLDTQGTSFNKGYIAIGGVDTSGINGTKTMYLDNVNKNLAWVCIKDMEIESLTDEEWEEISKNCNGADEVRVSCDGSLQSGYTCSAVDSDTYKITGLKHSGVIQTEAPDDGGNNGGSGGSSSGGFIQVNEAPEIIDIINDIAESQEATKDLLQDEGYAKPAPVVEYGEPEEPEEKPNYWPLIIAIAAVTVVIGGLIFMTQQKSGKKKKDKEKKNQV